MRLRGSISASKTPDETDTVLCTNKKGAREDVLAKFGAHIFFDDQHVHTDPASEVVASVVVPYRDGDDPSK